MLDGMRILAALVLSTLIGGLAYRHRSLSASGWLGAVLVGTLTCGFGGWSWGLTVVLFFVTSSALSHVQLERKQRLAGEKFEKGGRRDMFQVLANGGAAALLALLYGLGGQPPALLALFAGLMATVTADTWATELGALSSHQPRLLTTWRPVEPGTSGGVTVHGLVASAAGALAIGLALSLGITLEQGSFPSDLLATAALGGIAGSLADSLLGATVQAIYRGPSGETERSTAASGAPNRQLRGWRWMNNDMVNLASSLAGGAIALGIWALLRG
jgi:uncharacterized protein (TIGR00297 family)